MADIRQWWDVVDQLRDTRISRSLRRRVGDWLHGQAAAPGLAARPPVELATAAVQAEAAMLRGPIDRRELVPALLTLALGADVLGTREGRDAPSVLWAPT